RRDGHIADNRVELAKLIDWYAAAEPNELDRTPYDLFFDFSGAMFGCLSTKDKAGNLRPFGRTPEGFTMFKLNKGHRDLSALERLAATCEYIADIIEADANTTPKPFKCDPGTRSFYIDDMQPFRGLDEVVFAYIAALAAAWPDPIPFHKVQKTSIHLVGVKESRIKEKLPRQLKPLVKATRGLGTRLEL
ncbi:MAG: hypothetical protein JNK93_04590, partial [Planctomycetia bacterium]|nr:hypothetical protein [Planctomycetia bacterium]